VPPFPAPCEKCNAVRAFDEFSRERRVAKGEMAAARGDYKFDLEFAFRCGTCGWRTEKILDAAGTLHKWSGKKHVTFKA